MDRLLMGSAYDFEREAVINQNISWLEIAMDDIQ
jgi:hypothetical protein